MTNAIDTSDAPGRLLKAFQRALVRGMIVGFLLGVLAGALPESLQNVALWAGIGLMLICTAAMVAYLSRNTELEWKGVSPAVSVLIGVLLGLTPVAWHYVEGRRNQNSGKPATAAQSRVPAMRGMPVRILTPVMPVARTQQEESSRATGESLDRLLLEVAEILNQKARPAIQAVFQSTSVITRGKSRSASAESDIADIQSRLATATSALVDLERSLDEIRSRNPSFSEELNTVFGDTTPLAELSSGLHDFSYSLEGGQNSSGADGAPGVPVNLRMDADKANRWIGECGQRMADLRASARTMVRP